ncbi:MAG: DUF2628 domain-containing protein [Clostridia bacterium]|nr:DUF2628 domain-containing protein [Clostridia bacterium]
MPQKQDKCAYCRAILFEDEDVVYCPECGAPHHRDCYNQLGECANKANHGLEIPMEEEVEGENQPEQEERPQGIPFDRDGHVCARCGKRSTSDTLFCPYCGTPFVEAGQQRQGGFTGAYSTFPNIDPYGGVNPNESLDGHVVSEVASYVRVNTQRYIPIFKRSADQNKKTGWNWSAFLFTYIWLFFRKCYREGLVAVLFSLLATVMQTPWNISLYTYLTTNNITIEALLPKTEAAYDHLLNLAQSIPPIAWVLYFLGTILIVAVSVVFGMYGDYLYRKRVSIRLDEIKKDDRFAADVTSAIIAAGGCNVFSAAAIMYAMNFISNLILTFFG